MGRGPDRSAGGREGRSGMGERLRVRGGKGGTVVEEEKEEEARGVGFAGTRRGGAVEEGV